MSQLVFGPAHRPVSAPLALQELEEVLELTAALQGEVFVCGGGRGHVTVAGHVMVQVDSGVALITVINWRETVTWYLIGSSFRPARTK